MMNLHSQFENLNFSSSKTLMDGTFVPSALKASPVTIVMLHGSGPMDRDQNTPTQKLDIFNALADGFANHGIGSFRYDKRGCGQSEGNFSTVSLNQLVGDAVAAVKLIHSKPETGKIILLGHSEGTVLAPLVASQTSLVSGMILLCPTISPLQDTLMAQAKRLDEMRMETSNIKRIFFSLIRRRQQSSEFNQLKLIERLRAASDEEIDELSSKGQSARLIRDWLAHDLENQMSAVNIPILSISGQKDIQCLPSESERIAKIAKGSVEYHCLKNLTHILRVDDEPPSFLRYEALSKKELDPRILDLSVKWVLIQTSS